MKTPAGYDPQPPRPPWGIRPPPRKTQSMQRPIVVAPAPNRVVIPIRQCLGMSAEPLVAPGQTVLTGEPIARAITTHPEQFAPKLHASISGTVTAVEDHAVAAPVEAREPCVIIESDRRDTDYRGYQDVGDPLEMEPAQICDLIADAGIVGLGGALFSTAGKLARNDDVHTLILNGAECEPYITCDEILMREHPVQILEGARIMMRALSATQTIVGVESDMPEARVAIWDAIEAAGVDDIHVSVVTAKYPAGGERQLIQLIMGEEVPEDKLPNDIGYVCHNVGTAVAIADFFHYGRPMISRIVTVTGRGIAEPMNIDARIGTLMSDLFHTAGDPLDEASHLVMGGPMMGISLPTAELPVTKTTNCLIVMTPREVSPTHFEMPCIRCGECNQVCPAQLLPQELLNADRLHDMAALTELGLKACIECGCCDYVCPSQILLTDRFVDAKAALREHEAEARRADRARRRFDAREARLERQRSRRDEELERQAGDAGSDDTIDDVMARVAARNAADDKDANK